MESILNQLFWLWAPISFLPAPLRIFVVIFVFLQVARPILFNLFPPLLNLLCRLFKKTLYVLSYPIMALISNVQLKRREAGYTGIPSWINFTEEFISFFEKFFNKLIQLTKKKKRDRAKIKKWSFFTASAFAILFTAAIVNNPNEWYAHKWKNAEKWLTREKLQKQLGLGRTEPSIKASEVTSSNQEELVLNAPYKNGGNIREAPTLKAPLLYTITVGEIVRFMNEEQVDSKGIKWLKVQTANGHIEGWISARIVKEKQQN